MSVKITDRTDLNEVLRGLSEAQGKDGKGLPPVHLWNPEFCGDLDMRIARDGTWFYMGSPIKRERLVRLFSTVLRHDEDDKYYLVTPVEKIGIQVDDAPFVVVDMDVHGEGEAQVIVFTTNVGDETVAGPEHPLRMTFDPETREPAPYVHVRARLDALINRAVYYKLVDLAVEEDVDGILQFGVWSAGTFFAFAPVKEL
ncbi:MAG: DUF1285 domain-containing protein [Alphaproteobacteria bacterium]|nr:MAG: DUF1285 domain-containing protein [Alphaproteobacteria bacterium]